MKNLVSHQLFLLQRASQDEGYLAHTLWTYCQVKEMNWSDLLNELGCDEQALLKLAICRNFKFTEPNFAEDVQQVSNFCLVDVVRLSNILKRSSFLLNLATNSTLSTSYPGSYLAAAREKESGADLPADDIL